MGKSIFSGQGGRKEVETLGRDTVKGWGVGAGILSVNG